MIKIYSYNVIDHVDNDNEIMTAYTFDDAPTECSYHPGTGGGRGPETVFRGDPKLCGHFVPAEGVKAEVAESVTGEMRLYLSHGKESRSFSAEEVALDVPECWGMGDYVADGAQKAKARR